MEQRQLSKKGVGIRGAGTALADLRLKIAEHLIDQADVYDFNELYNILAETKVGARRRTELMDKVRLVFSIS